MVNDDQAVGLRGEKNGEVGIMETVGVDMINTSVYGESW